MGEDDGVADDRVENTVTGGMYFETVIQGRNITVQLPRTITPALSGLPAPSPAFTGRHEQVATLLGDLAPTADRRSVDRWLEPAGTALGGGERRG
ncbi:hypothetical protein SAMN02787118_11854 [Streptomyces mirabilis]|uniref:Uncharacterized protein n=2 Tax=Streptomyces mirabilis TaxID=68239 RepID=A0A1I2QK20_9ACTN|nr:hypothetical protein SAMN02787118_11854 [Streptomyces mirabilis]